MNFALIAGAIIAFYILTRYSKGRGAGYKWLLSGCFVLLFLAAVSLAIVSGKDKIWYVAGTIPIATAYMAVFVSLLIKPYSLNEATAVFTVPDYMDTVDLSEFMGETFDRMPSADHKGKALYTLLRVLYVITSSRKDANTRFQQVMKTAFMLYDARDFTPNSIFFSHICMEITVGLSAKALQFNATSIRCAANLAYEAILSCHKSEEFEIQ